MMEDHMQSMREALEQFKDRMGQLEDELHSINRELGRIDLLALAFRTRELLRRTKGLLDGNIAILFEKQPPRVSEDLYQHIEYAEGHIAKALAEEYRFEAIKQRLYMATSLAEYVIRGVGKAVERLEGGEHISMQ